MRASRRLIVFFLLLFLGTSNYVYTAVYYAFNGESSASITAPDVHLEQGTAGTSVVYPNATSAASQVDSHATTFYPNGYNITQGTYSSGTCPNSVNQEDISYFIVDVMGSNTSSIQYSPSNYSLLGDTSYVSGSLGNLTIADEVDMSFRSKILVTNNEDYVDNNSSDVDSSPDTGTHSNFTAQQSGPDSVIDILTESDVSVQSGVLQRSLGSAIPYPFGKDKTAHFATVFFNPTNASISVTYVEFRVNTTAQPFGVVTNGPGLSYPTSGWTLSGDEKYFYWSGSVTVNPYSAAAFWVSTRANKQLVNQTILVKVTAGGTNYFDTGWLVETLDNIEVVQVALEESTVYPTYNVTVNGGEEHTFSVTLEEAGAKIAIPIGLTLNIDVPDEFTNIISIGGTGWGTAQINGNNITVNTTQTLLSNKITYQFNATSPEGIKTSLYMMNVTTSGNSAVPGFQIKASAEVCIKVLYTPKYRLDLEVQWTDVDFDNVNETMCLYGVTMGAEDILVDVWYNSTWNNVLTDLSSGWNNVSMDSYLDTSTFTIRLRGSSESSDQVQDSWQIDASLLYLWKTEYIAEVEFEGTSNLYDWTQIEWLFNTSWTTDSVNVILQLYDYNTLSYPTSGDGYINYTSGTMNTHEAQNQTITTTPENYRNGTGGWKLKIWGQKVTGTQFDLNIDQIYFKPTYYNEVTAETEFIFTDVTDNQSPYLNFTVVTHNSVDGATVTIQVWNYTSSSFPSSGMGYLSYVSTGANNTRWLNVTNNAQSCLSGSYARIRVTSVYATTESYQQLTNFVRLLQEESILVNDYALRVTNGGADLYTVRLIRVSDSNIDRLINCTIYLSSGETQLQVIDGVFTLTTGTWANLPAASSLDMVIEASTVHLQYASVIDAELEVLRSGTSTYTMFPIQFTIT